jgi:hypothetical protein
MVVSESRVDHAADSWAVHLGESWKHTVWCLEYHEAHERVNASGPPLLHLCLWNPPSVWPKATWKSEDGLKPQF